MWLCQFIAGASRGSEQVPTRPGRLQESIGPSQGLSQHTPSAQNSEPMHSVSSTHA
jgi:hypothetical protein